MDPVKKRSRKPIYILGGLVILFMLFIYGLTRPSTLSTAKSELEICYNKKDVEMCWYKYKPDLYKNEDFLYLVRTKLQSLNLSEVDIDDCKSWLPPAPTSVNIIVIPDLSRRIIDTINNPNQVNNDKLILYGIWEAFEERSKYKQDTKDKLIVDVTDIDQAKGQFGMVANELQFDLSTHRGKTNRLYFTNNRDMQFQSSIDKMYELAKEKPLGADYHFYFRRYLNKQLKKSTLFDNYINKVIIISDGYLEAENRKVDTKILGYEKLLYPAVTNATISETLTRNNLFIPPVDINLNNVQFLICEVNERQIGKGFDYEILNEYWKKWLASMGAKVNDREFFLQREKASNVTLSKINDFILN